MAQLKPEQSPDAPLEAPTEEEMLRRRLVSRIAVAGVVIVALLGGLAVIDALYVPPPQQAPAKLADAPMVTRSEPENAATAPGNADEAEKTTEPAEEPHAQIPPADEDKTAAPVPSSQLPALSDRGAKDITPPASFRPTHIKPTPALPMPTPTRELAASVAPSHSPERQALHAPASKPLTYNESKQNRFVVQMGVFNNVANAEELRAKLELNGIPAQIEARVQVGPFKSKQEAEEARIKMAALGLDTGLLMAIRK